MDFFKKYVSNTYAGSANQLYFSTKGEVCVGRVFYKISVGGEYNYSILFSNTIDSTYADGSVSQKNLICEGWELLGARIGKCAQIGKGAEALKAPEVDEASFVALTFGGKLAKSVARGELFSSDPVSYSFEKGEYLCLEITYSGDMIPYHEESILPVFVKRENGWEYCKTMPFASMVGCDREVKARVAYAGDSITQGIGVPTNSYLFWNARVSEALGEEYAFWNLGIGFGRANDASSDGAWLYKVKQNDAVVVCYGVNDICQGMDEEQIKSDLSTIVDKLKEKGCMVILQTIPPFDYDKEKTEKWLRINEYIKTTLSKKVDLVFDNTPYLGKSEDEPQVAKYGGHPNEQGCEIWANALYNKICENELLK
ncbi:MAG: SGNH/GDSL hydrolase family protein [Clostridia bacterium]|nr:SGNH/GDSL hydrolase family protein [Clostridia bacterium]